MEVTVAILALAIMAFGLTAIIIGLKEFINMLASAQPPPTVPSESGELTGSD